jgi:ribosomal protein S18 acetylase RimI-like enzyme
MIVHEARSLSDLRRFIAFPRSLYRADHFWAPPLWSDERAAYSPDTNAILAHSDFTLLMAEAEGRVVGRSLAYVDHAFNDYYKTRIGFFGAFECVDDPTVAGALDAATVAWLADRGMTRVRGPIHPVSESWGFLLPGAATPPVFMTPYNPPRYNDLMVRLGYEKAKDLLVYEASPERAYRIPERFLAFRDRMLGAKTGFSVRPLSLRNLEEDADAIYRISNIALKDNWGFVPVNRDEFQDVFRKLRAIVDPEAVWFVEDDGLPVGFALGFPDLNVILRRIRGRLFPTGFLHLLLGIKKVKDYSLFGLAVLPAYQGRGLDALLYCELYRALAPRIRRLEANYILEDNTSIRNALEKLGMDFVKSYRVYEKDLPVSSSKA